MKRSILFAVPAGSARNLLPGQVGGDDERQGRVPIGAPMQQSHSVRSPDLQTGSTALGAGFAIPHARINGIARPLTLFMRTRLPVAFDAPDGKPVSDLLAIMVPADGAKEDHLQLLALVARLFSARPRLPHATRERAQYDNGRGRVPGCGRAGNGRLVVATVPWFLLT